jgi:hypothetical protein
MARSSTLIKSGPKRKTWEEKTAERARHEAMKQYERQLQAEQRAEHAAAAERVKANRKRRAENENKSVQYQVVSQLGAMCSAWILTRCSRRLPTRTRSRR